MSNYSDGKNTRYEENDGQQVAIPVGFQRPPTLAEQVARLVRSEKVREMAANMGKESFDEADDFEDEDDDPSTPYERDFDLAAVHASHGGIVEPPARNPRGEELLQKIKSGKFKKGKKNVKKDVGDLSHPNDYPNPDDDSAGGVDDDE